MGLIPAFDAKNVIPFISMVSSEEYQLLVSALYANVAFRVICVEPDIGRFVFGSYRVSDQLRLHDVGLS